MLFILKNKNYYIDIINTSELKIQIFNLRQIRKQIMMYPHNGHSITIKISMKTLNTKYLNMK